MHNAAQRFDKFLVIQSSISVNRFYLLLRFQLRSAVDWEPEATAVMAVEVIARGMMNLTPRKDVLAGTPPPIPGRVPSPCSTIAGRVTTRNTGNILRLFGASLRAIRVSVIWSTELEGRRPRALLNE